MDIEKLRYPIGKFNPDEIKIEMIDEWIDDLRLFPKMLVEVVAGLNKEQLQYTYRPEGWNVQQVVHHIADSHMNSIIRFKLALSEDNPTIKPYIESEWAKQHDVEAVAIDASLQIINGVHARLSSLLSDLNVTDFARIYSHPQYGTSWDLAYTLGLYAWHGKHHLKHIKNALKFKKVSWS